MIEFFTIVGFLIAVVSVFFKFTNGQKKIIFWIFLLFLILFDGLRWKMGTDWINYYNHFLNSNTSDQPGMEIGFKLYTSLFKDLTDNYSIYLFITTAFIYVGIFYNIFKLTNYSLFSISFLAGHIPWYSGSLRQMIACVFFTVSLKYLLERKFTYFLLAMLIGSTFHISIITFLPTYFLYGLSLTTFLILFTLIFFISSLVGSYLSTLDQIIQIMNPGKSIADKFGGEELKNTNPVLGFSRKIITSSIYYYFYIIFRKAHKGHVNKKIDFFIYMTSFSILLYFLGAYYIENLSSRLDIYTGILCASVLFGILDIELKNQKKRLLLALFLLFMISIFYFKLEFMDLFHPYSSIFYNYDFERNLY